MPNQNRGQFDFKKLPKYIWVIPALMCIINPSFIFIFFVVFLSFIKRKKDFMSLLNKTSSVSPSLNLSLPETAFMRVASPVPSTLRTTNNFVNALSGLSTLFVAPSVNRQLKKNKKYLQVALNGSLNESLNVLRGLPTSEKIIIEAGTPLIKSEGIGVIRRLQYAMPGSYIVADMKTADLGEQEVAMCAQAGASAVVCLGVAPIEVIGGFIAACEKYNVEAMLDMMNVPSAILVLKKLKKMPRVVILHRGVDETESNKEKQIPFYEIKQVKGTSNCLVSVAGGDTAREVQSAIFNDADIVVVWKDFYTSNTTTDKIVTGFLKEIR